MSRKLTAIMLMLVFMFTFVLPGRVLADEHWAQSCLDQLDSRYPVSSTLNGYDFDDDINMKDLEALLDCTFGAEVDFASCSRQEVVSKLVDVFAERAGINLDDILFVALVPFLDFDEINPDYTRNIMYAYSCGLIKGRGNDMLEPAEILSFGEAFVLLSRLDSMIAEDSFYVDASVIKQDRSINFNFKLLNRSGRDQDLTFASSQIYELVVSDRSGKEVYRYSDNMMFAQMITDKTVAAGDFIPGQVVWDVTDKDGNLLPEGRYSVQVTFTPLESSLSAVLSFDI